MTSSSRWKLIQTLAIYCALQFSDMLLLLNADENVTMAAFQKF